MKNILVALDGTGQTAASETNVQILARWAEESAAATVLYRRGIDSVRRENLKGAGITGRGTNRLVRRAWQRLCAAYEHGDRLAVIGYSRGGAAAISLANLVWACGLPRAGRSSSVAHEAMRVYGAREGYAGIRRVQFGARYGATSVRVGLLGLFDPVGALGWPLRGRASRYWFGQHDFTVRPHVDRYCAFLALDEHRSLFRPILQTGPHWRAMTVSQAWVPGCHGDVGGGGGQPLAAETLAEMKLRLSDAFAVRHVGKPSDSLNPSMITSSWRLPYRLMPRVERPVGIGIAGETLAPITRRWLAVFDPSELPQTASWRGAAELYRR